MNAETSHFAELVAAARAVREHAYAPYSKYQVGAAIRGASGAIYRGCNVESASYGAAICAERSALAALVAAGERSFDAIAVYTDASPPAMPCGICRQSLFELGAGALVVVASPRGTESVTLAELLPRPFVLKP
jgi:cytidine deaminase